jgi:hypothetical protein
MNVFCDADILGQKGGDKVVVYCKVVEPAGG